MLALSEAVAPGTASHIATGSAPAVCRARSREASVVDLAS
jgi:hypothetical protein